MPLPRFEELLAPPAWRSIEFISDLHLHASEPATFEAWRRYMAGTQADAVFILGDLFEVWVGDDAALEPGFAADCASVLLGATQQRPVFFMHGNRDFLVGETLLRTARVTLLQDPTVLAFAGQRLLLSHGDALCIDDAGYQAFRAKVRTTTWQSEFLSRPLAQRQEIARGLREESMERGRTGGDYADVNADLAAQWLRAADAPVLVHGHTHQPREHALGGGLRRIVLSDWDAASRPPRLEALRLDAAGLRRVALA